ncbi:MAG: IS1 family transposase [Gemmatimonadetes bacterium]|nr:IS1 family transposase [Gemmatimonadota bacterium]
MNVLPQTKQVAILKALTEGSSVRATARLVGVSKDTVLKLLVQVGQFCELYQDYALRRLPSVRIEADEIWAFVGKKQKHARGPGMGDCWTFTAIDPDSKLMVTWLVGMRTAENFNTFMRDLAGRMSGRIQLTTDGNTHYLNAVLGAFKIEKTRCLGNPDPKLVSTSYVERNNLDLRMRSRRFTRLTNGFSKKEENHAYAVALHFMVYNFCRPHGTLTKERKGVHTTPAMAAGVTGHVWKMEAILDAMNAETLIGS